MTEVCEIITNKDTGCLEKLLELGFSGELAVHNEIKKSELTMGDMIGQGAFFIDYYSLNHFR